MANGGATLTVQSDVGTVKLAQSAVEKMKDVSLFRSRKTKSVATSRLPTRLRLRCPPAGETLWNKGRTSIHGLRPYMCAFCKAGQPGQLIVRAVLRRFAPYKGSRLACWLGRRFKAFHSLRSPPETRAPLRRFTAIPSQRPFTEITSADGLFYFPRIVRRLIPWVKIWNSFGGSTARTKPSCNANTKKQVKIQIPAASRHYARELMEEVNADRQAHGKKPFDDDDEPPAPTKKRRNNTSKKKLAIWKWNACHPALDGGKRFKSSRNTPVILLLFPSVFLLPNKKTALARLPKQVFLPADPTQNFEWDFPFNCKME